MAIGDLLADRVIEVMRQLYLKGGIDEIDDAIVIEGKNLL